MFFLNIDVFKNDLKNRYFKKKLKGTYYHCFVKLIILSFNIEKSEKNEETAGLLNNQNTLTVQ